MVAVGVCWLLCWWVDWFVWVVRVVLGLFWVGGFGWLASGVYGGELTVRWVEFVAVVL